MKKQLVYIFINGARSPGSLPFRKPVGGERLKLPAAAPAGAYEERI